MSRTRTALIVGGGIAGPATAMALLKAGIESTVYEAHPTGADGVGSFLTLAANGLDALRVLGVDEAAMAVGFPTPSITLRNARGRHLGETLTGPQPAGGAGSHTMKRADLYAVLHDAAVGRGVDVQLGRRLVSASSSDGGGVRAVFADGTEAVADVLIGADGVHSTVRRLIDPAAPAPTYAGLITTGGYARGVTVDAPTGVYEMIFGRRAFFGYATAPDGEVWWFSNVPQRPEPARGSLAGDWRSRLMELHRGDAGPALPLIEASGDMLPMSAIHSIPHLPRWHRDGMVVIGDAAHAPSPTSGQGASLSIEDALVLAQCLRDWPATDAFARFEERRRPRVERIIKAAARINNSKAAGPVGGFIRDAVMPLFLRMAARGAAAETVYHVDWNEPAVRQ
jgi:2-polyprenyl-6-methoxyphenol hydroxylase-like FAD-dependent oxidoreductase